MSLALKLALSPVLLAQALWARWRVPRLPEADGPREGQVGAGEDCRLLVIGDSSAAGVGVDCQQQALAAPLAAQLARRCARRVHWRLLARSGINTLQAESLWQEAGAPVAHLVVVVTGVNDVVDQVSPHRAMAARRALAARLMQHAGAQHLVFAALPPMGRFAGLAQPLRWMAGRDAGVHDQALADWADATGGVSRLGFDLPLDAALLAHDGFHPGPQVYAAWALALATHLHVQLQAGVAQSRGIGRGLPSRSMAT